MYIITIILVIIIIMFFFMTGIYDKANKGESILYIMNCLITFIQERPTRYSLENMMTYVGKKILKFRQKSSTQ